MPIFEKVLKKLEEKILLRSNKKYCVVTGNATTGIYLAIKSLNLKKPKILMPNSVCHNVHLAILLSGGVPIFIDINRKNLGIDFLKLSKLKKPDVIISPHSYGNPCHINKIKKFCSDNRIVLIEDCALVSGAKIKKNFFGDFGDFSVFSFGKDKVMDLDFGGAVLTNDYKTYSQIKLSVLKLKNLSKNQSDAIYKINKDFKYIYNKYFIENQSKQISNKYKEKIIKKSKNLLFKLNANQVKTIYKKFNTIDELITKKINKYNKISEIYKKYNFKKIKHLKNTKFSIPWKFNLIIMKKRNIIFKELLENNFSISSWYAPNNLFISKNIKYKNFKNSYFISDHILNIPLNKNYQYYIKIFSKLKKFENANSQ
tara:strand:+ start:6972 stop:8081 length:1110 start_codon:yes stop_codon:yes gene_type:complete